MKYTNSRQISVEIDPWFDKGYMFTKLQVIESLGGDLAYGTLDMELDGSPESLELVTSGSTGTITLSKEGGWRFKMPFFVTSRVWLRNRISLGIVCTSKKSFYTDLVNLDYSGMEIDKTLGLLWPGELDIRCQSDIQKLPRLYQATESAKDLCSRVSLGYRRNSVFGYTWDEKLIIKEVPGISGTGEKEPGLTIVGDRGEVMVTPIEFPYNLTNYIEPVDPNKDDPDLVSKNFKIQRYYGTYSFIGLEYADLLDNIRYNQRFYDGNLFSSMVMTTYGLLNYRLGDVINFRWSDQSKKYPFEHFLVASNELFISKEGAQVLDADGKPFSIKTRLIGIQENGSILPREDKTSEA